MHSQPAETASAQLPRFRAVAALAARLPRLELQLTRRNCLYALLYGLVLAGAWLRVDYILQFNPVDHLWSDPQRHWEQGIDALRADPMALTDPLLFQLYIGALAKLTLKNPLLVAFYTALLSLLTPWLWYRFLRELQPSRLLATAGWAALALLPSWIAIYGYFMQETLLLPLLGAALWASWRCRRKQTLGSFLLMALLWALAGLTRGIAIPLAAVICSWLWLEQGDRWRKAAYALLLLGLILGPLTVRGYQQLGIFAPHGNGKLVSLYTRSGNKEISIHYRRGGQQWNYWFASPTSEAPLAPLSDWRSARRGTAEISIDLQRGNADWQAAAEKYPLTLPRYLWITGENLIYLFFAPSWPDQNRARALDRLNIQLRWLWAPLALLLLVGTVAFRRRLRGRWQLPAMLLMWLLVQGLLPVSVNEGRYRKPAEGLLIAQAVLLLSLRRRRDRNSDEKKGTEGQGAAAATETARDIMRPHYPTVAALTAAGLLATAGGARLWQQHALASQLADSGWLYLSQLDADFQQQGWGHLGRDRSVDQGPLRIRGRDYRRGLGVHAPSEIRYRIPAGAHYFHSGFGLDDDGRRGLVRFSAALDGRTVYDSGAFHWGDPGELLLPLDGAEMLTLRVDALGSRDFDHAAWIEARFLSRAPDAIPTEDGAAQ